MTEHDDELWDEPPGRGHEPDDEEPGSDPDGPSEPIEQERTEQLERRETPLH